MSTVPFSRSRNTPLEKPLPNNLDAERSVLGSILLDNAALKTAAETLSSGDFFLDQNQRLFRKMLAIMEAKRPIDMVTLVDELQTAGDLEAAGGMAYIASLADGMPKVSNVAHYARIVRDKSLLRQLIHVTHNVQQKALAGDMSAKELSAELDA